PRSKVSFSGGAAPLAGTVSAAVHLMPWPDLGHVHGAAGGVAGGGAAETRRGGRRSDGGRAEDSSVTGDLIVELDRALELGVARVGDGDCKIAEAVVLAGAARLDWRERARHRRHWLLNLRYRRIGAHNGIVIQNAAVLDPVQYDPGIKSDR